MNPIQTQNNPIFPGKNSASQSAEGSDEIVIRTMNSDLSGKKPISIKNETPSFSSQKSAPNFDRPKAAGPANSLPISPFITPSIKEKTETPPPSPVIPPLARPSFPSTPQSTIPNNISETAEKNPFFGNDEVIPPSDEKYGGGLSWGKVLVISLCSLVVVSLIAGVYFFWMTRETPVVTKNEPVPPVAPVREEPETPAAPIETDKYSLKNPNYLSVNTEDTAANIKKVLESAASDVKAMKSPSPVEFIITDSNNNAIAFKIFALALGMKLTPDVLNNFEENFSLYVTNDVDKTRIALAIDLTDQKNASQMASLFKSKEKTLVNDLSPLLLETAELKNKTFSDSDYNSHKIRYVNVDSQNTLSIDYTITPTQLIIGTSKNSFRAVLDKIDAENRILERPATENQNNIEIEDVR